jgi:HPt (histidine-containing phosphotransfer) domain-containing protein
MGNDQELFHEMVDLLRSDAPPLLSAAQNAHREGDPSGLQWAAHTLKGLASNFGAERAVAAAADVERLAKARQSSGLPAAITELEESLSELIAALAPSHEMSSSS